MYRRSTKNKCDQNPADLCTRGRTPEESSDCALWWNGPELEWLLDHRDRWPKMQLDNCPNDQPDKKTANRWNDSDKNVEEITCHHQRPVFERKEIRDTKIADWRLDPRRYFNWVHLIGVYAGVQRFVNNMRKAEKELARVVNRGKTRC